jgi:probable rRNA maturation factor
MTVEIRNRQRRKVNTRRLRQLAGQIHRTGSLSLVLVNDRQMAELNLRYHHVAGPTDVLTFDYGGGHAEVIVSVDQAYARGKPARELALYVVHGILHLAGYDDRTPAQRRRMRAAERRLLAKSGVALRSNA